MTVLHSTTTITPTHQSLQDGYCLMRRFVATDILNQSRSDIKSGLRVWCSYVASCDAQMRWTVYRCNEQLAGREFRRKSISRSAARHRRFESVRSARCKSAACVDAISARSIWERFINTLQYSCT